MKNLKPVRRCIYCQFAGELTREHIVPSGLGGDWVLPKASCRDCAEITGRFERNVLRGSLWPARGALNLGSRRKRQRPDDFPMMITRDGQEERVNTPIEDLVQAVPLPMFGKPGFLREEEPSQGILTRGAYMGYLARSPAEVVEAHGAEKLALEVELPTVEFAKMIGKIAYGFAVAKLGLDRVAEPLLLPAVLGKTTDIGHWVGTAGGNATPPRGRGSCTPPN